MASMGGLRVKELCHCQEQSRVVSLASAKCDASYDLIGCLSFLFGC